MIPYAPALESASDVGLRERYGLFIGGAWVDPAADAFVPTDDPATESPLALVARAGDADVDRAVRAARRAYDKYWRKLKAPERAKYLYRIARTLAERTRAFALLESLDRGFPIRFAREHVARASETAFYYAGWADKLPWAIRGHERAHAPGVACALVSSRSPLAWTLDLIAPALAAGNTVVVKPSSTTPLCALALAQLCDDVDVPPGVFNVVTGDAQTGAALVDHADVDLLAVEGSPAAIASVRRVTAGRRTRLRARPDGSATIVAYDDAPTDALLEAIVAATHRTGDAHAAFATHVLVQENVAAEIVARATDRLARVRHGDPLDRNTDVGAFASRAERDRSNARIEAAVAAGARAVVAPWSPPEVGAFAAASFVVDLPPSFDLGGDDAAAAFVGLSTFRTPAEALERAGSLPQPISGSIWTMTGAQALFTAQRLHAETVWCNTLGAPTSGPMGRLSTLRGYIDP